MKEILYLMHLSAYEVKIIATYLKGFKQKKTNSLRAHSHDTPLLPPIGIVFYYSWDTFMFYEKLQTMISKILGVKEVYYGIYALYYLLAF